MKKLDKPTYSKLFHKMADRDLIGKIYLNDLMDREKAALESRKWSFITGVTFFVWYFLEHEDLYFGMFWGAVIVGYFPWHYHKEAIKLRKTRLAQAHYLEISPDEDST